MSLFLNFDFRNEQKYQKKIKELKFEIKRAAPQICDSQVEDEDDIEPPDYVQQQKDQSTSADLKFVYKTWKAKHDNPFKNLFCFLFRVNSFLG